MRVCIAGTFNVLHKGHKQLLQKAFEYAGENGVVYVGITDGEIALKKKHLIPFNKRVKAIDDYLFSKGYENRYTIIPIQDKIGPAADSDYDAIIVSPETYPNAQKINNKRIHIGKQPLRIIEVPHVLADDKKPISSTRILNKEIDEEGRIIS